MTTDFILEREQHDANSTRSRFLTASGGLICNALERCKIGPDHPRIPAGRYQLQRRKVGDSRFDRAPKNFPKVPEFKDWYQGIIEITAVPARTAILIHPANHWQELLGCVAPATDIDHGDDGWTAQASRDAFTLLYRGHLYPALAQGATFLTVVDKD